MDFNQEGKHTGLEGQFKFNSFNLKDCLSVHLWYGVVGIKVHIQVRIFL